MLRLALTSMIWSLSDGRNTRWRSYNDSRYDYGFSYGCSLLGSYCVVGEQDTMTKLLGIDPGGTTGLAIYDSQFGSESDPYNDNCYLGFVAKTPGGVLRHINDSNYDLLIVEDYNGQLISSDGLMTVRLIGAIEGLCYLKGIPRVLQFPQERYRFKEQAKRLVASFGPDTRHARDAMMHLLLYQQRLMDDTVEMICGKRRKLGEHQ